MNNSASICCKILSIFWAALILSNQGANAADADLDTTFGLHRVITPVGRAYDAAVQSDGKIIAVGINSGFSVVRYETNGDLDNSFGDGDGIVSTPIDTSVDQGLNEARSVVIQSDGKIVVAGVHALDYGGYGLTLIRYDSSGNLDTTFGGGDGIVANASYNSIDVALQSDNKINGVSI